MDNNILLDFGEPEKENSIIKVIGVGGGGGNAVNHMYREGIHDVTFVLCNTDNQALNDSPVPVHLQLGKEGLGAGNRPERARAAAEERLEDIKNVLSDGTRMAFITAGMGGGTGTGAAPVIARISKELGILTVGIVTIPFRFEGDRKIDQALDGVEEMSKHVDALLVINNERLREIYPELTVLDAFGKADDTLSVAAKSIAEIITMRGRINLAMLAIRENFPKAHIVLLTPIHRGFARFGANNVQPDEAYANELGLFIDDYVHELKRAGEIWSVPVIDLFSTSGLLPMRDGLTMIRVKELTEK